MKVLLIWSELGWEYKSGYINSIKLLKKTSYSSAIPVMALKEEIVQPIPFLFWLYCTYRIPELFRTQDFWKVSVGTRLWAADPSGLLQEHCWSLLSSVASSRWAPRYTAWWHCGPSRFSYQSQASRLYSWPTTLYYMDIATAISHSALMRYLTISLAVDSQWVFWCAYADWFFKVT